MTIFMGILVLLALTGIGATVRNLRSDGLRRIPTRRHPQPARRSPHPAARTATRTPPSSPHAPPT